MLEVVPEGREGLLCSLKNIDRSYEEYPPIVHDFPYGVAKFATKVR